MRRIAVRGTVAPGVAAGVLSSRVGVRRSVPRRVAPAMGPAGVVRRAASSGVVARPRSVRAAASPLVVRTGTTRLAAALRARTAWIPTIGAVRACRPAGAGPRGACLVCRVPAIAPLGLRARGAALAAPGRAGPVGRVAGGRAVLRAGRTDRTRVAGPPRPRLVRPPGASALGGVRRAAACRLVACAMSVLARRHGPPGALGFGLGQRRPRPLRCARPQGRAALAAGQGRRGLLLQFQGRHVARDWSTAPRPPSDRAKQAQPPGAVSAG